MAQTTELKITEIQQDKMSVTLVGRTPLYCHRLPAKAKHQLLIGGRKKTAAERAEIKHHPWQEFRDSMDLHYNAHPHAVVMFPATAFKAAMTTAAMESPQIKGTQVRRLVFLPTDLVPIFGYPRLKMDVTRSADINKTPDIRTRAFFPEWATELTIHFARPALSHTSVASLLHNAGMICGVGDFRQEKGKGNYGSFRLVDSASDEDGALVESLKDKERQVDCIENPVAHDDATRDLMAVYMDAVQAAT